MGSGGKPEAYRKGYGKAEDKCDFGGSGFRVPFHCYLRVPASPCPLVSPSQPPRPGSRVAALGLMGYDGTSPK